MRSEFNSFLCNEGVDTSTPNGRLVFGVFASIAEFERELMCERVRSGAEASGLASGSGLENRRTTAPDGAPFY